MARTRRPRSPALVFGPHVVPAACNPPSLLPAPPHASCPMSSSLPEEARCSIRGLPWHSPYTCRRRTCKKGEVEGRADWAFSQSWSPFPAAVLMRSFGPKGKAGPSCFCSGQGLGSGHSLRVVHFREVLTSALVAIHVLRGIQHHLVVAQHVDLSHAGGRACGLQ